jgi:hypothetical protein
MKLRYDLSKNVCNTKPILWNVSEHRVNNLLHQLVSIFPMCITELIIDYDYNFEGKIDHILINHSSHIVSTCFFNENIILSLPKHTSDKPKIWNLMENSDNLTITSKQIPIIKSYGTFAVVLNKNDKSYICIVTYDIVVLNRAHNLIIWTNNTNNSFENLNDWKINFVLSGHTKRIYHIHAIDDYRLATCSKDQTIRIWNLCNGECETILTGHFGKIRRIVSLSKNLIASTSDDKTIKIWNINTYECEHTLNNESIALSVGISYNKLNRTEYIIVASYDNIKIWRKDANIYKCIRTIKYKYQRCGYQVAGYANMCIHQNNKIVVIFDNLIKIFNIEQHELHEPDECDMELIGHTDTISAITILPDGKIASSSLDKTIRIWDLDECDDSKKLTQCEIITLDSLKQSDKNNIIYYLKILPDGRLIGYSFDNTMIIWK